MCMHIKTPGICRDVKFHEFFFIAKRKESLCEETVYVSWTSNSIGLVPTQGLRVKGVE